MNLNELELTYNVRNGSNEDIVTSNLNPSTVWIKIHVSGWLECPKSTFEEAVAVRMNDVDKRRIAWI